MKTLKHSFLLAALLLIAPFSFAQSDNDNEEDETDEIIILNKKDFLEKVFNYEVHKDTFIYEGKLPCIVDFYADWCPPCKIVDPILKKLAKEYKGKIIIYKVNTDNERELAKAFSISNIPTYFFISAKSEPGSAKGALTRESFVKIIDEILLKD